MSQLLTEPMALLAAFAAFWFGGAALMARLAGWHALSALYPAPARFHGEELPFCTATLGSTSFPITYRRCVRVFLSPQGIGLRLMFPFRFHSPPFFVPWSAVRSCTERQLFSTRKVTFTFAATNRQLTFAGPLGQVARSRYNAVAANAA
jgi:hypothetical protein